MLTILDRPDSSPLLPIIGKRAMKVWQKGKFMPFAELKDNVKIHYDLKGKGLEAARMNLAVVSNAAVLMACRKEGFEPGEGSVAALLAANRPVLNYSYRGSGQSSVPKTLDEYSVAAYRGDTQQLLAQTGLGSVNMIGYSHGGYFAADYALYYPSQVSTLVLVEPALFVDRAKLEARIRLTREGNGDGAIHLLMKQMMPELAMNSSEYNALVNDIKHNYPNPIGLAGEWYARSTNEFGDNELSQISVPTLIIGGTRSWVRENIERAASVIPGAQHVRLDGTHNLMEEKPAEVAAAIESFLAAHNSKG